MIKKYKEAKGGGRWDVVAVEVKEGLGNLIM